MIRVNKNMEKLLEKSKVNKGEINVDVDELSKIISPNFKEIYDCVIIDINNEVKLEDVNFKRILRMFGDRTGYEASCNEIRVNDYVNYCDENTILELSKLMVSRWEHKLKTEYPQYNFCIILSFNEGYATMRFHIIRDNESSWLKSNLDEYETEALLVNEF